MSKDIAYIPDHVKRAVDRLYFQHRFKPRIRALLSALAESVQTVEDMAFDLLVSTTLSAASGGQLDLWGKIVGERRLGLDDRDYRRFLEARILANLSEGTTDRMIRVFEIVTGAVSVRHFSHYPAAFRLAAYRQTPMSDRLRQRVHDFMHEIKPAGVDLSMSESLDGEFAFSDEDNGFGSNFARVI